MKKLLSILFLLQICTLAFAQKPYWQQQTNYNIAVTLNDTLNTLTGVAQIEYSNNSPDTLHFIWIHLWPNAYKNDRTALSDQLLLIGSTDFYFAEENKKGYINRLNFTVDKATALTEDDEQHQDIVKLILPKALAPSQKILIETPFNVKLPYNFSRGGHVGQSYQITQWYPKPAVYDKDGWHPMPYLDQGEFYSEFGNFVVQITLPQNYVVAATGELQNDDEKVWLKQRNTENNIGVDFDKKTKKFTTPTSSTLTKTLLYKQNNVHDFAWFADKTFVVQTDTMQLQIGNVILVNSFALPQNKALYKNSIAYIKNAVKTKNNWVGTYPYNVVSVVDNAAPTGGGMEYPTITLLTAKTQHELEDVINHEVGHNWFYGILGSNERDYPWLDEGVNTYYDLRYNDEAAITKVTANKQNDFLSKRIPENIEKTLLQTIIYNKKDQPINTSSQNFTQTNYALVGYYKTACWLQQLEKKIGTATFDKAMQAYYEQWKFKHPSPANFRAAFEQASNTNLSENFDLLNKKGPLPTAQKRYTSKATFFNLQNTEVQKYISFAPAVGFNYYDKLMIGGLVHNYNLPPTKLQFIVAPLYATGTKKINGIGNFNYTMWQTKTGAKFIVSGTVAKFTGGSFTDSTNTKNPLQFSKVVPAIKYIFGNNNVQSTVTKYVQFKTYLIKETNILFERDIITSSNKITYPTAKRYVNELQVGIVNSRVLYPYKATFNGIQGDGFVRVALTTNYYFNYQKGGGLGVRLFAGKFIYTADKTFTNQFKTDPYHLNLTGPKGYEDYSYNNYFVGRSEFDGFSSQQIMNRDGFFKVRTDLLSNKIGKTDDWLVAVNFTTDFPKAINPLEVLPIKIPLKFFVDIGTFAEAFNKNSPTGKFLYDAGIQLPLFKNVVNVYIPILYSKVYSNYFKSTILEKRFVKNISFTIDLQQVKPSKLFSLLKM